MIKLMIATPAQNGLVDIEYAHAFAATILEMSKAGFRTKVSMRRTGSLLITERNVICAEFMASDCTHLMCIDADIGWNPMDIMNLMAKDKDIIGACYLSKGDRGYILRTIDDKPIEIGEDGLIEVAAIPMGFVMISRRALELMAREHFALRYESKLDGGVGYGLFNTCVRDGEYWGEDFSFFLRARDAGLSIWVDPAIVLHHAGSTGKLLDAILSNKMESSP